jgi:hypothetical protein
MRHNPPYFPDLIDHDVLSSIRTKDALARDYAHDLLAALREAYKYCPVDVQDRIAVVIAAATVREL